jgi:hypothetical protein
VKDTDTPLKDVDRIEVPEPKARDRHPKPVPENSILHWRIYYRTGQTISSKDCTWAEAPARDIVAIAHALNDEPADCEFGTNYYWRYQDWIARVWDPTLYLRQTGLVKFGRWASYAQFYAAWKEALHSIAVTPVEHEQIINERTMESGIAFTTEVVNSQESGQTWSLYYDTQALVTSQVATWEQAPSDGVLCATYSSVYSGLKLKAAMRRYTYYFWRGHELINTDDLDEVLSHFPQCKYGQPTFAGKSYRHQAEAIAQALKDTLEDLR